ncbi:Endo-1,3(4)-beta-glucanase [Rasamsonia emersonii CBS 393.64]|uniref:Endo-1,3(4)-beta-glucanase n=1 Tax=Rasamsonia emersonii (strain ATCC 16479 / CBS 393.64 / IMI 116815) TaxID=1408163 RepID=A0A0F4YI48_RASE3|nr:Endo-1,3(4)-beta-glucanase [Rasamsonia emersonii CBS 393.64]KKA17785.1 Endo-1,3(4)-beta-glucanase [Rasamsonia emersonii CBS 393.64]
MVLDDASPQASGFEDGSSAADSYMSTPLPPPPVDPGSPFAKYYPLVVKPELIKRPGIFTMYLGFGGPWFWEKSVTRTIQKRIDNSKALLQRSPTQNEVDAFVENASRRVIQARMGVPLGLLVGCVHSYSRIRTEADLPRDKPFARALWDYVRVARHADPFGLRSMFGWTLFRVSTWMFLGSLVSSSIATMNEMANTVKDPRLRQLRERVEELARRKVITRQPQQQQTQTTAERPAGSESQTSASEPAYGRPDAYYGGSEGKEQQFGSWRLPVPEQREPARQQTEYSSGSDFFDDASPVAPEYQTVSSTSSSSSSSSSSTSPSSQNAWERIRQQNAGLSSPSSNQSNVWATISQNASSSSQPQQPQQPQQQTQDRSNESYETEVQARQREREQAQREFDRMLEEERRMSQENSNTEQNGRGWRRW